ncbi:MAG: flippase activity-associated protein Agl23, partial [Halobacteriota archaeon]
VEEVRVASEGNDGPDVVFVGARFYSPEEPRAGGRASDGWGARLPIPWYLERAGAESTSVSGPDDLSTLASTPPVVIADASQRELLTSRLEGYDAAEYDLGLWDRTVVVFVEQ